MKDAAVRISDARMRYGWITVGGHEGPKGKHEGGTHVEVDDRGTIQKGPKSIKGNNLDAISRDHGATINPPVATASSPEEAKADYQKNGVKSKEFKSWFGDWEHDPKSASKVVNEKGEPQETTSKVSRDGKPIGVFHGTASGGWNSFDKSKLKDANTLLYGPGFYFTEDKSVADEYRDLGDKSFENSLKMGDSEVTSLFRNRLLDALERSEDSLRGDRWEAAIRGKMSRMSEMIESIDSKKLGADQWKSTANLKALNSLGVKTSDAIESRDLAETKNAYLNIRSPFDVDSMIDLNSFGLRLEKVNTQDVAKNVAQWPTREAIGGQQQIAASAIEDTKRAIKASGSMSGADLYHAMSENHGKAVATAILQSLGYDGVTHLGSSSFDKSHRVWIAFEPNQIKSVNNQGTFDPKDNRMDYQKRFQSAKLNYSRKSAKNQMGFNWDEDLHPREADGEFAKKGGGSAAAKSSESVTDVKSAVSVESPENVETRPESLHEKNPEHVSVLSSEANDPVTEKQPDSQDETESDRLAAKFGRKAAAGAKPKGFTHWGLSRGDNGSENGEIHVIKGVRYLQVDRTKRSYWSADDLEDQDMFDVRPGGAYQWTGIPVEPDEAEAEIDKRHSDAKARVERMSQIVGLVLSPDRHSWDRPKMDGMVEAWDQGKAGNASAMFTDGKRLIYMRSEYDNGVGYWTLDDPVLAAEVQKIGEEKKAADKPLPSVSIAKPANPVKVVEKKPEATKVESGSRSTSLVNEKATAGQPIRFRGNTYANKDAIKDLGAKVGAFARWDGAAKVWTIEAKSAKNRDALVNGIDALAKKGVEAYDKRIEAAKLRYSQWDESKVVRDATGKFHEWREPTKCPSCPECGSANITYARTRGDGNAVCSDCKSVFTDEEYGKEPSIERLMVQDAIDGYGKQRGLFDEDEHPRDEGGKFAEKDPFSGGAFVEWPNGKSGNAKTGTYPRRPSPSQIPPSSDESIIAGDLIAPRNQFSLSLVPIGRLRATEEIDTPKKVEEYRQMYSSGKRVAPIIVDNFGRVRDGHHRFQAAKDEGFTHIWAMRRTLPKTAKNMTQSCSSDEIASESSKPKDLKAASSMRDEGGKFIGKTDAPKAVFHGTSMEEAIKLYASPEVKKYPGLWVTDTSERSHRYANAKSGHGVSFDDRGLLHHAASVTIEPEKPMEMSRRKNNDNKSTATSLDQAEALIGEGQPIKISNVKIGECDNSHCACHAHAAFVAGDKSKAIELAKKNIEMYGDKSRFPYLEEGKPKDLKQAASMSLKDFAKSQGKNADDDSAKAAHEALKKKHS